MPVKALEWCKAHYPNSYELAISVVFGILIEIVILGFQPPLLMVRRVGDDTADQMIRLLERTTSSIPRSPAFVFIDIDDATYATWKAWGSHLVTPRAYLATLLERVARSKPLAVALDVDLAYPDGTDGKSLKVFLENYKPEWPPLLFVRSLADDPDGGLPQPRITDYDAAMTVNGQRRPGPGQGQRDLHFAVIRARRRRQSAALEAFRRGMQRSCANRRAFHAPRRGDDRAASDLRSASGG